MLVPFLEFNFFFIVSPPSSNFHEPLETSQIGELAHGKTEPSIFSRRKEIKTEKK